MKSTALTLIAVCIMAGPAYAADQVVDAKSQSSLGQQIEPFEQIDKNKDTVVSKDEAKRVSWLNKNFDAWDTDRDGKLNKFEYDSGLANPSSQMN